MVTELSKRIKLSDDSNFDLINYFPTLLWILRDFHLELVDEYGIKISQDEYLENALKEQVGFSNDVMERNKIRTLLKTFFKDRHCCTLVRPANSEMDLQNLSSQKSKLRTQFEEQMAGVRKFVFNGLKPKSLNGFPMTGKMYLPLVNTLVSSLNKAPVVLR